MAEYTAPGVYVEEVPPKVRPIAGVGSSTAGFIGVSTAGTATVGKPELVSSWEEFKAKFGDFKDVAEADRVLAQAVYGFLNNGGRNCWVTKVADLTSVATNLEAFEPIDEIAIVAVPGAVTKVQQDAIAAHCKKLKDRIAVLDGAKGTADLTFATVTNGSAANDYAALYFPWIQVYDPVKKDVVAQPPSGHVAGIYANVSATKGVFKAPANEPVVGAVGLERKLTKDQQGLLNPKGANIIRAFDGTIKVFGARTLGGDDNGNTKYVSTRRYLNYLEESIDEGTQWVVFEPHTPALWQRIIRSVSDFLFNEWRSGGLFGETAKQAFFVKCDAELNPPSVRNAGQVITEIGVAIAQPAEFVIFRIEQTTGS